MTKFQTILLALIAATVAGALYKFVPDAKEIAAGVAAIAVWLFGYVKQHPADKFSDTTKIMVLVLGAMSLSMTACHTVKPDALWGATVDCAKVNPENSAAKSAVINCLTGMVMSNTTACVTGLVVGMKYDDPEIESKVKIRWVIDEVACVTSWVAQQENAKVGTPNERLRTQPTRNAAIDWLVSNHISIRNSYSGAP